MGALRPLSPTRRGGGRRVASEYTPARRRGQRPPARGRRRPPHFAFGSRHFWGSSMRRNALARPHNDVAFPRLALYWRRSLRSSATAAAPAPLSGAVGVRAATRGCSILIPLGDSPCLAPAP